jgi:mRNA-degrading endonuclease RelE of RelBE toxin-antitoxin system
MNGSLGNGRICPLEAVDTSMKCRGERDGRLAMSKRSMPMNERSASIRRFTTSKESLWRSIRSIPRTEAISEYQIRGKRGGWYRVITRKDVAEKLIGYLEHRLTVEELVDWSERALMEEELDESDVDTLREILARLGAADVRAFALTWDDCEEILKRLGYRVQVQVQEVEQV